MGIGLNFSMPRRCGNRRPRFCCSLTAPTISLTNTKNTSLAKCARPLATKAARSFWFPKLVPKPSNRSDVFENRPRAAQSAEFAQRSAIARASVEALEMAESEIRRQCGLTEALEDLAHAPRPD